MKTICHCAYCSKHPLYNKRHELKIPVGFDVGKFVLGDVGKEVTCLEPIAEAFFRGGLDAEDYEFPVTAYGDGAAITVFNFFGQELSANCENEDYLGKRE